MTTNEKTNTPRRNAVMAGFSYIAATVAPISTIFFVGFLGGEIAGGGPIPDYLAFIAANKTQVVLGMFVELTYALAVVGIIVYLFPTLKKQNEVSALGFSALRFIETICIIVGSIILLTLLTLGQKFVEAGVSDAAYFQTTGDLLLAARDWTFLIGSGLVWSLSALVLNHLLFQAKLVPRWISVWGFFGTALSLAAYLPEFFGSESVEILFLPIAVQEMVFAVWLIVKGFNSPAVVSNLATAETDEVYG